MNKRKKGGGNSQNREVLMSGRTGEPGKEKGVDQGDSKKKDREGKLKIYGAIRKGKGGRPPT